MKNKPTLASKPRLANKEWGDATKAVRGGTMRSQFNEHSEAMFLTSSFIFDSAQEAADKFADRFEEGEPGFVYSRYDNPNTAMLEARLATLEGAEAVISYSSGLAAHVAVIMTFLKAGDELVSARDIFGSTYKLYDYWFRRFGINTHFVDIDDLDAWQSAITPNTKMLYVESPSNPLNRIANFAALAKIAKAHGIMLVADNTFATPYVQKPLLLGANLVTYSGTKFFDGQGRTLSGFVAGSEKHITELRSFLRSFGSSLSPFNAWIIFKGLETLTLRVERQCSSAFAIAQQLEKHPRIEAVSYPWLATHPQHSLAKSQMNAGGTIISFTVKTTADNAQKETWQVIDALTIFSCTANFGDTRSTVSHPATTTHGKLSPEDRIKAGIQENTIRLAIGLESEKDLWQDINQALLKG